MSKREEDLYLSITVWFEKWLRAKNKGCEIVVADTHNIRLSKFISEIGGKDKFSLSDTFDIQVDITGVIKRKEIWELALIEVKVRSLTLKNVGQLLGYCIVSCPMYAFLISPQGPNRSLSRLITTYGRRDILEYHKGRYIRLGRWVTVRNEIDPHSIIPKGMHS